MMNFLMNLFIRPSSPSGSLLTLLIEEYPDQSLLFDACDKYLCSKFVFGSDSDSDRANMIKTLKVHETNELDLDTPRLRLASGRRIKEVFDGIEFVWKHTRRGKVRCFELMVDAEQRKTLDSYLSFVCKYCDDMRHKRWPKKYILLDGFYGEWSDWRYHFKHPMTFRFLAMDPDLKKSIVHDLDGFMSTSELHKRFYFLYGPRGAGKSCLIASIANYLKYDLYPMCLDEVEDESTLRSLIDDVPDRSILVIEETEHLDNYSMDRDKDDDDDQDERISKISLVGLLNFVDELWSSDCGSKRVLLFSTHRKEKLEPAAVLQPGHVIDMYIYMSYLTVPVFRILASTYLGISIDEHPLFGEIVRLMQTVDVTAAEVVSNVMQRYDAETALQGFVELLNDKKSQAENKSSVAEYQFCLGRRCSESRESIRKRI